MTILLLLIINYYIIIIYINRYISYIINLLATDLFINPPTMMDILYKLYIIYLIYFYIITTLLQHKIEVTLQKKSLHREALKKCFFFRNNS